jgi:Uma2 family endonuclease
MSAGRSERLWTAEEYIRLPDFGFDTELFRGMIVELNRRGFRHGKRCVRIVYMITQFLNQHDVGRLTSNNAGVVTERNPDTVRGPDVAFYSYFRLPKEVEPVGYPETAPDLVMEVLSPELRWPEARERIDEYLGCGVTVVCVLDPDERKLYQYTVDHSRVALGVDDAFDVPSILPGLRIPVKKFFS